MLKISHINRFSFAPATPREFLAEVVQSWSRFSYRLLWGGVMVMVVCWLTGWRSGGELYGQNVDASFQREIQLIAGLRDRRLFDLANWHCDRLLARTDWNDDQRVLLTIERMKTLVSQASISEPAQRAPMWEQVQLTASDFLQRNPNNARSLLVRVQAALCYLYRGELLQQELAAEMVPFTAVDAQREESLQALRQATSMLNEIEREVLKSIPERRNRTLAPYQLTAEELMNLNNQIRLQIGMASMGRAQLYPANDRLNRIDALLNVLQRLQEIQGQTAPQQPIWWEAHVLQLETFRLLKRYDDAQRVVASVNQFLADEEVVNLRVDRWLRELILLALDRGDESQMMVLLQEAEAMADRSPELELARLLAAKEFSLRYQGAEKTEWLNRAAQLSRSIEFRFGSYWGRRAKLILIGEQSAEIAAADNLDPPSYRSLPDRQAAGAELDLLIGLAEQAERRERYQDALKAYDRAIETARLLDGAEEEFSLGVRAAQMLEKMNQPQSAAERFIQLALAQPEQSLASAVHLRGCWNWGRWLAAHFEQEEQDPAATQQLRFQFMELLQQHLDTWSNSDTTSQIHFWLGNQYQLAAIQANQDLPRQPGEGESPPENPAELFWKRAFQHYTSVVPADPSFSQAIQQAGTVGKRWAEVTERSQQTKVAQEIVSRLKNIADQAQSHPQQRVIATVVWVEMGILSGLERPAQFLAGIESVLPTAESLLPTDPWGNRLLSWRLVVATFDSEQESEFYQLLDRISTDLRWLAVADQGIAAVEKNFSEISSQASKIRWEGLVRKVLSSYQSQLSAADEQFWKFRWADILVELERFEQGLEILEQLEKQRPTDAGIKLRMARLLVKLKGDQDPAIPLAMWRKLGAQLKPHTEGWYEARYNTALMLKKMGQTEDARKMLEYLKAIPPGWENSRFKPEFERLLQGL